MSQPGQWEAKLGWLGAYLAGQDALHVEIFSREKFVTVAWERMGASRQECNFSLEDLARPWAPYKLRPDSSNRSVLLGALGYEIDQVQLNTASILEEEDGFLVTGSINGRYENRCFPYAELGELRERLSADRDAPATAPGAPEGFVAPNQHNSPLRHRLHLTP